MSELLAPPGSDEWFRAALVTANRRRWRHLFATSGVALSCSMLLALGPMTHPSADRPMEIVTPPTPSKNPVAAPRNAEPPTPVVPSSAPGGRSGQGTVRPPAPAPTVKRDSPFAKTTRGQNMALSCAVGSWCLDAGRGVQGRKGEVPLSASMCSMGRADDLVFETDLEMDFVVENIKGLVVARYSDTRPARPDRHTLGWGVPGICYTWRTSWTGVRADGTRVPGAYVLRVVPRTQAASLVTRSNLIRFDLT